MIPVFLNCCLGMLLGLYGVDEAISVSTKALLPVQPLAQAKLQELERRARIGEAQSAKKLGELYETGEEGASKDPAKAFEWFSRAANLGDLYALEKIAWDLINGEGTPANPNEGARRFREAADRGSGYAMYNLGWLHEQGKGVAKDDALALAWYRKGAEAGNEDAMSALGWLMENGRGGPKDDAGAAQLYFQASEKGHAQAKTNLGWLFVEGRGVPTKSLPVALNLFTEAAAMGNARAMGNLGYLHENGLGISKNPEVAFSYFSQSADLGDVSSQAHLGWMLERGIGTPIAVSVAAVWYEKAGDQGDQGAAMQAARLHLYQKGTGLAPEKGMEILQSLVRQGFIPAFGNLAGEYLAGRVVKKNPQEAERLLHLGVDQGSPAAAFMLEQLYRNGVDLPKNPEREQHFARRARELLSLAVAGGDLQAKAIQSELKIRERSSAEGAESLPELQRKAKAGDPAALFALGLVYQNRGAGLKADMKRAFDCFEKAAGLGFPPAKFQAGLYTEQGWGVAKNLKKALEYYKKAAEDGNPQAMERIQALGPRGE